MIRWREMLMDYGQMYDNQQNLNQQNLSGIKVGGSQRSGSSFFTVNGDLMAKKQADQELRRTLEVHFRPLFQRFVYGGEKIACHDLKRILRDPNYRDRLPIDKVHELVDVADFNIGKSIKYEEFVRVVTGSVSDNFSDLGSTEGVPPEPSCLAAPLRTVCRNTAQQNLINEKLEQNICLPPPFFIILVTVAQIILYIIYTNGDGGEAKPLEGVPSNNSLMYMPTRRREAWRFFSYSLLHQGYVDLIFNVIIQIVVGIPLEVTFSWWRIALVYIIGVMVGSTSQSVSDLDVGLVGAGGGAYAILGAHMIALWRNRKHLNLNVAESKTVHILCSVALRFVLLLILIIPQVVLAVYRRWFLDDIPVKIGIAAHVGGFFAGMALGPAFLKDPKLNPFTQGSGILDLLILLALTGAAVIFNIAFDGYPDEDYTSLSTFVTSP